LDFRLLKLLKLGFWVGKVAQAWLLGGYWVAEMAQSWILGG